MTARTTLQIALALLVCGSSVQAQGDDLRPGVAVMALQNGGSYGKAPEDLEALRYGLQAFLLNELSVNSALRIVERHELRAILEEQSLLSDSLVTPQTAARIGQLVGARYMVLGSFTVLFRDFHLTTRVVDTETGEVLVSRGVHDKDEKIYELVVELAGQLTDAVDLPPLPDEVQEQRNSRNMPEEALLRVSRALWWEEKGEPERAVELLRGIAEDFPDVPQANEELRRLTSG